MSQIAELSSREPTNASASVTVKTGASEHDDAVDDGSFRSASSAADRAGRASDVRCGLIMAAAALVGNTAAERSSAVGQQLLSLLREPPTLVAAVFETVDPRTPTAAAIGLTGHAPTYVDRPYFSPPHQFWCVPATWLSLADGTRRQRRRLQGARFIFDTPEAVAVAAGDVQAMLSHVLRIDAASIDGGRIRSLLARDCHQRGGVGSCGEDVLRALDENPRLFQCGYPMLDPCAIAVKTGSPWDGFTSDRLHPSLDDELAFRTVVSNVFVAAAFADRADMILAMLLVVPLHAMCDILVTCAEPFAQSIKVGYSPADLYAACDVARFGSHASWTPIHFVAGCGSTAVVSACLAIIAAADGHTPHLTSRDAVANKMRTLPFSNESAARVAADVVHLGKSVPPQLALHRLLTVGTNIRTTPLQVAAAAKNSAFLEGLLAHGQAFSRRRDVHETYARATLAGLIEEVAVEAAAAGLVGLFNAAATAAESFCQSGAVVSPALLTRAADLAFMEQRIEALVAVSRRGGVPSEHCVRVSPSSILVQAHKAGAALPGNALQRIGDSM